MPTGSPLNIANGRSAWRRPDRLPHPLRRPLGRAKLKDPHMSKVIKRAALAVLAIFTLAVFGPALLWFASVAWLAVTGQSFN